MCSSSAASPAQCLTDRRSLVRQTERQPEAYQQQLPIDLKAGKNNVGNYKLIFWIDVSGELIPVI